MKVTLGMSIISRIKFPLYLSLTLLTGWPAHAADNVLTVGVAPHGGYIILGGSVIPLKEVTLAAQIPGRIIDIAGEEGDEFAAGTKLVKINDDDLLAKKAAAEAPHSKVTQITRTRYVNDAWYRLAVNGRLQ